MFRCLPYGIQMQEPRIGKTEHVDLLIPTDTYDVLLHLFSSTIRNQCLAPIWIGKGSRGMGKPGIYPWHQILGGCKTVTKKEKKMA
ncbi:unnamed protein product [Larinioides sclopetarius]|uniref:Uncharacterized protein n=1 Tax=Larinioides sclopetarius TaxID=280406 RepID=A0AAV1Z9X0_9ARAC